MPTCSRVLLSCCPNSRSFTLFASLLGLLLQPVLTRAQAPVGRWQIHAPGTSVSIVAETGSALICAGAYGFFRYDRTDNSVRTLSRQDGFADVNVSAMAYDSTSGQLVIAYADATLDLLHSADNTITTLLDIERKEVTGIKRINHVGVGNRRAYLATSFGIVVVDLDRYEVRDTYANLGAAGQVLEVYATTVLGDSLYAATSDGLLVGSLRANLLDFSNWRRWPTQRPRALATLAGHVYSAEEGIGVRRRDGGQWTTLLSFAEALTPYSLTPARAVGALAVARDKGFTLLQADGSPVLDFRHPELGTVAQAVRGQDGLFYLAEPNQGLFVVPAGGGTPSLVAPNGPVGNVAWATAPAGAATYAVAGGYSSGTVGTNLQVGFSRLQDGAWDNYSARTLPAAGQFPVGKDIDLSALAFNATNGKLYLASYGFGLIEWGGPGDFRHFDSRNSPLLSSTGDPNDVGYTRLTGVAVDPAGVVWVVNFSQATGGAGLFSFDPATSQWRPHLAGSFQGVRRKGIVIDDNGYKWLTPFAAPRGADLIVYDDVTGVSRTLTSTAGSGGLLGEVMAITKDRLGAIWIGTTKGVQVFDTPAQVLQAPPNFTAVTARQPRNGGRFLFEDQLVTAIAVDGGNRKWIGTEQGVWLFDEAGEEALAHFTTENSPLPSDKVLSLSVNGVTGEVFVGTERGLVSYRGSATEPAAGAPTCAKVFPNPVPARFQGQIALDNLAPNAVVKITDVAGLLVYETKANGSRAVWDARDYQGRRVRTGIYLAYTADADGNNTCISKIAVTGE